MQKSFRFPPKWISHSSIGCTSVVGNARVIRESWEFAGTGNVPGAAQPGKEFQIYPKMLKYRSEPTNVMFISPGVQILGGNDPTHLALLLLCIHSSF